jgi:hypothetical protein
MKFLGPPYKKTWRTMVSYLEDIVPTENKRESYGNSPVTLKHTQYPLKTTNFSGEIHVQRQDRAQHQMPDRMLCILDIYEKMMPNQEGSRTPSPLHRVSPNS